MTSNQEELSFQESRMYVLEKLRYITDECFCQKEFEFELQDDDAFRMAMIALCVRGGFDMSLVWFRTEDIKPITGDVVLGYWYYLVIESVVMTDDGWTTASEHFQEKRNEPVYWAKLPNLPSSKEKRK